MKVTNEITIYLDDARRIPPIHAVQSDTARYVEVSLYAGDKAWEIPSQSEIMIRYRRSDGAGGTYDTLADGSKAWSISENTVTIALDPMVLAVSGNATVQIAIQNGNAIVSTFSFAVHVQADPSIGSIHPSAAPSLRGTLRIIVFPAFDGYITETSMEDIQAAFKAGRAMRCVLETDSQELLYLPLSKEQRGVYHFATVCDGMEWLVTIAAGDDGNAVTTVTHDAVGSGGVYVGSEEPEDESVNVWINPDGETYDPPQGAASLQPLTFTGAVEAIYDGTQPVQVEIPTDDHINELINAALAGIPNASEVAY